jgi:hypothetical protein
MKGIISGPSLKILFGNKALASIAPDHLVLLAEWNMSNSIIKPMNCAARTLPGNIVGKNVVDIWNKVSTLASTGRAQICQALFMSTIIQSRISKIGGFPAPTARYFKADDHRFSFIDLFQFI